MNKQILFTIDTTPPLNAAFLAIDPMTINSECELQLDKQYRELNFAKLRIILIVRGCVGYDSFLGNLCVSIISLHKLSSSMLDDAATTCDGMVMALYGFLPFPAQIRGQNRILRGKYTSYSSHIIKSWLLPVVSISYQPFLFLDTLDQIFGSETPSRSY